MMVTQQIEACSLCGEKAHLVVGSAPGYREGRTYMIYECDGCRASFASPLESDDDLYGRIYRNIRTVPGYNRYHRYAHEVLNRKSPLDYLSRQEESYWAVTRHLRTGRYAAGTMNILEVGCGMGYFTYALAKDGFLVTGVDISSQAIDWAREHYGPYYETVSLRDLGSRGLRYEKVIMNQLIEHVPDIQGLISEALALLSGHGELIITTPNKSAYPGAEWETDLPPVHLWWLGEDTMRYIAHRNHCSVSFIDFTPFYRSLSRPRVPATPVVRRTPIFSSDGTLLITDELPPLSHFRRTAEKTGVLTVLRRARAAIGTNSKWSGVQGPIIAAVFRRKE